MPDYVVVISVQNHRKGQYRPDIAEFVCYIDVIADLSNPLVVAQHHRRLKHFGQRRPLLVTKHVFQLREDALGRCRIRRRFRRLARLVVWRSLALRVVRSKLWRLAHAKSFCRVAPLVHHTPEDVDRHDRRRRCRLTCMMHSSKHLRRTHRSQHCC